MCILQVPAEPDTVPWCLLVFSHTGPSLPPVPPLFASAALLLEANPGKKGKTQYFTTWFCTVYRHASEVLWKLPKTNADMRVFTHVLTTSAVRKIPQGRTGTVVNTANTTVLKTDTTACCYRQPAEGKNLRPRPGPVSAAVPGEAFTHRYCHMTHPPGQCRRKAEALVKGGGGGGSFMQSRPDQIRPDQKDQHLGQIPIPIPNSEYLSKYAPISPCRNEWWHIHKN